MKYLRCDFENDDADGKPFPKTPRYDEKLPEIYIDQGLNDLFSRGATPMEILLYRVLLQTGLREREVMSLWIRLMNRSPNRLHFAVGTPGCPRRR